MSLNLRSPAFTATTRILALVAVVLVLANLGTPTQAQLLADFGDAPDNGFDAYPGVPGRFPTLLNTGNAVVPGNQGAHHLTVNEEWLAQTGIVVPSTTVESDAKLLDMDEDDARVQLSCPRAFPIRGAAICFLLIDAVHVGATAPGVTRFVNALVDFNRNGRWDPEEHVIVDHPIIILPNGSRTLVSAAVPFAVIPPVLPVWVRVTLTRAPLHVELISEVVEIDGARP